MILISSEHLPPFIAAVGSSLPLLLPLLPDRGDTLALPLEEFFLLLPPAPEDDDDELQEAPGPSPESEPI